MTVLLIIKVTIVLGGALAVVAAMRRASAATRHLWLLAAMLICLALPVSERLVPDWRVLPAGLSEFAGTGEATDSSATKTVSAREPAAAATTLEVVDAADRVVRSSSPPSASGWLPAIWMIGLALGLMRLAAAVVATGRNFGRARPDVTVENRACVDHLRRTFGIAKPVVLRQGDAGSMPSVWGFRQPVILLPAAARLWEDSRRRDVIAHELAHVARGDGWTILLAQLFVCIYWFHPLAWMLKHRLTAESERAADDLALSVSGPAERYADHLLRTASESQPTYSIAPVMAARSQLEQRIMAILTKTTNREATTPLTRLIVLSVAAVALYPLSGIAIAQDEYSADAVAERIEGQSDSADFAAHLMALNISRSDVDALLAGLTASDPLTRGASAWALGAHDDRRIVEPLVQAGYDADARVRQWALRSLARWSDPAVAALQIDRLQDGEAEVRQWAVRGLSSQGAEVRTQPLLDAMNDVDWEVREWSVRGLAGIDDPVVTTTLAAALATEQNADVAEWLTRTLASTETGDIDAMLGALQNPEAEVRQWAVRGLRGETEERVVDALIGMLGDSDAEVRQWSVRALGYCGNERAVAPLEGLESDGDEEVREWVQHSLEAIACTARMRDDIQRR